MRWSLGIGTIAGIRVELHVTFVLFVGWVAISRGLLTGQLGPSLAAVALLLAIFACVLLHELGHALAARRYGIVTRDIVLLPIGGVARLQRMPDKPQQEIVVAIAGPAVNVAIAATLWLAGDALGRPVVVEMMRGGALETLFAVNVLMVGFNMIPAFPMDGGRVLRALLALRLPYLKATRIASAIGQTIALLFGVIGFFYNPMLMFVALFVFLAAGEEHAMVQTRASLVGLPARAAMITEFESLDVSDPLQRAVDLLMAGDQQDFPVLDRGAPVGILTRADLILALQRGGPTTPVGEVVAREGHVVDAGEPLEEVFRRMREKRCTALPVVSGGGLVGLVTLENVSELLLVQGALKRFSARR
ncbi:MAG: site-2 protease family protein [Candidatus Eisenbacteria bacterium]|uniref:Zinc metalloprotease n=1 Tax=Eiseniibacteriota bacterium TaxID=2212470 RepID=A0A538TND5_UNCEI|nr:MAG: site-2 protease family protein [Candidatus Eisenbacteria bacterium]